MAGKQLIARDILLDLPTIFAFSIALPIIIAEPVEPAHIAWDVPLSYSLYVCLKTCMSCVSTGDTKNYTQLAS